MRQIVQGYNSTILAHGQTGTGKSYTMFGPEKTNSDADLGFTQRCCDYLFAFKEK